MAPLLKLEEINLKRIQGLACRGRIQVSTLEYLSTNVDEILANKRLKRKLLEEDIANSIRYRSGFQDVVAYFVSDERSTHHPPLSFANIECDVDCYAFLPGAHCNWPAEDNS